MCIRDRVSDFSRFQLEGMTSELPKRYEIEYIIFQLCDGDVTKRQDIERLTLEEATEWFCMSKYKSYMEDKFLKKK